MNLEHPILPNSEVNELIAEYQTTNNNEIAERILYHNERLIFSVVQRYYYSGACGDTQIDDLMQWGRIGLLRAMQDFDIKKGTKFTSYAYWWIRQYVSRNGKQDGQSITMSSGATTSKYRVSVAQAEFIQQHHREATFEELEQIAGITNIAALMSFTISIDGSENNPHLNAYIESIIDETANVEEAGIQRADNKFDRELLNIFLDDLPETWRTVMRMLYGLDGREVLSRKEIAKIMGVSRERIRQFEEQSLEKLKKNPILVNKSHSDWLST